jgi:hypothetical protein
VTIIPATRVALNKRIHGLNLAWYKSETLLETQPKQRAGGITQMLEHLLNKHKTLSSNPSMTKIIIIIIHKNYRNGE